MTDQKISSAVKDDIFVLSRSQGSDTLIHAIIKLDSRVDITLLEKALLHTINTHPILSSRFVLNQGEHAYWGKPLENDNKPFHQLVISNNPDSEISQFLTTSLNFTTDNIFNLLIIRNKSDILCFKVSHVLSDAGGVKELVGKVADTYTKLHAKIPIGTEIKHIERSLSQIYKQFGFFKKILILLHGVKVFVDQRYPKKNWKMPLLPDQHKKKNVVKLYIDAEQFNRLKKYCKINQVTLNDLITATIFRALHNHIKPPKNTTLRIISTVDLRRYLLAKQPNSIANLASLICINIGSELGKDIFETIKKVHATMQWQKKGYIGLDSHLFSVKKPEFVPYWLYSKLYTFSKRLKSKLNPMPALPVFTNMGKLDYDAVKFADTLTEEAYLTAPIANHPGFIIGMSGFNNTLTLTSGYCESVISPQAIKSLFNHITKDLDDIKRWVENNSFN